jgi:hypothetical protein
MDYQEFKKTLKKCDLTIKEFSNMCGLNEKSISANWKKVNETPQWVDVFLSNYQKARIIDNIKEKVCPIKDNDE